MIDGLTGAWAVSTFGFISAALIPIPFVMYKFGAQLRAHSKYTPSVPASMMKNGRDEEMQLRESQMDDRMTGM